MVAEGGSFDEEVQVNEKEESKNATFKCSVSATRSHSSEQFGPSSGLISSLLNGLSNCSINFAPQISTFTFELALVSKKWMS